MNRLSPILTHTYTPFPHTTLFRSLIENRTQAARKVQLHPRAFAHGAVDLDVATTLFDEAEHHTQTKPGALAIGLGGEEWLEHLLEHLRRNADAGKIGRAHV